MTAKVESKIQVLSAMTVVCVIDGSNRRVFSLGCLGGIRQYIVFLYDDTCKVCRDTMCYFSFAKGCGSEKSQFLKGSTVWTHVG